MQTSPERVFNNKLQAFLLLIFLAQRVEGTRVATSGSTGGIRNAAASVEADHSHLV